jgi:hypothetical protein
MSDPLSRPTTLMEPPHGWLERLVRCAILAPSSHNTQPWRFLMSGDHVELWADRSRQLRVTDPAGRELAMSCGAALFNLRVACHRFGRESTITLLPDPDEPDLLAQAGCGLSRPASLEDQSFFEAIFRRRTHRQPFDDRGIGERVIRRLVAVAEREGAWLVPIEGARKRELGEVVEEATRQQFRDRQFRVELASWMRPGTRRLDGMPGYALGYGALSSRLAPWVVRGLDVSGTQATKQRRLVDGSPLACVLGTDRDTGAHWLRAGQALERVLLAATAEGLFASYLNAPIQLEEYRPRLAAITGVAGKPQIVLRLGYAGPQRATARRPLAEVIKPLA